MDPVTAKGRSTVRIDYHQFWLLEPNRRPSQAVLVTNGLIGVAAPGSAMVYTGISSGWVTVEVEARTAAPASVDVDGWDEVVEVSLSAPYGQVGVAALMDDVPDIIPKLTATGAGEYRVRVHARGRDNVPDEVSRKPVELYRLVAWPDAEAPELLYKLTDECGAAMRRSATTAPPPRPSRPVDPQRAMVDKVLREGVRQPPTRS